MTWQRFSKALCLIALATTLSPFGPGWAAERVAVRTMDGTTLVGDLHLPPSQARPKAPLVVLLHMLSRNRGDWQPYIPGLTAKGNAVLAMDLRGHGESTRRDQVRLSWRNFSRADYARMPGDLLETLDALSTYRNRIDLNRVAVIGASIGCNVALVAAAEHQAIRALVLLSPGLDYRGIQTERAMRRYGPRPILLVASEGDSYSADSTKTLYALAVGPKKIKIYSGRAHGTQILERIPQATSLILGWLDRFFPQTP